MAKCSFCSKEIVPAKGTMLIKKTGKVLHYCSSKCEKNTIKLKRNPAKKKWSKKKE